MVLEQAGSGRQSSIFEDELVAAALPRIYTPHETSGDVCAIEPQAENVIASASGPKAAFGSC
jgi:hypothetical protein